MNNESINEWDIVWTEDVKQIGIKEKPDQIPYIRVDKSLVSRSKEGDEYSSPARNSEVFMSLKDYERQQESGLELERSIHPYSQTRSQLVFKVQKEDEGVQSPPSMGAMDQLLLMSFCPIPTGGRR